MRIELDTNHLSAELLINIANAIGDEIDNPASGYAHATQVLVNHFNTICGVIKSALPDDELSDYVRFPNATM